MTNLQEIAQSEDYGQYGLKELYQATHLLLQEFQKSKTEPEKLNHIIDHLKERLKGQAAYPLAILLESSQLGIRHQLQNDWNSPVKQRQLYLFESLFFQYRGKVPTTVWNQICLNYAEVLIYVGRSIDGLHVLEQMTEDDSDPSYQRKDAERGWALLFYSTFLTDKEDRADALHKSRELLGQGAETIADANGRALYADRLKLAQKMLDEIGPIDVTANYKPNFYEGREKEYRDWCAQNHLLLNHDNEIDPEGMMKMDTLRFRSKGPDKDRNALLEAFMDGLISEFTAYREQLFEALQLEASDPSRTEQLKSVFRQSFSLFNKSTQFLNHYYKLEVKDQRAGMQRIWFEEEHPKNDLKPFIRDTKNGALKALYWLSKEMYGYERSDAQNLAMIRTLQLRDQLERSFVQVITKQEELAASAELRKHQISLAELERLAMSTTFKARNALMYLGFAVGVEKRV